MELLIGYLVLLALIIVFVSAGSIKGIPKQVEKKETWEDEE